MRPGLLQAHWPRGSPSPALLGHAASFYPSHRVWLHVPKASSCAQESHGHLGSMEGAAEQCPPEPVPMARPSEPCPLAPCKCLSVHSPHLLALQIAQRGGGRQPAPHCQLAWHSTAWGGGGNTPGWDPGGPTGVELGLVWSSAGWHGYHAGDSQPQSLCHLLGPSDSRGGAHPIGDTSWGTRG